MTWYPGGTQPHDSRGRRAARKSGATVRWAILVALCGLGLAAAVGALVVGVATLIQSST